MHSNKPVCHHVSTALSWICGTAQATHKPMATSRTMHTHINIDSVMQQQQHICISTATQQHKNAWRNKRTKSTCSMASGWRHRSKKVVWSSKTFLETLGAHAAVHENFSCKRVVVGSAWTPFASLLRPLATPRRREKKCVMRKRGQTVLSC